jgi:hypothetical protein
VILTEATVYDRTQSLFESLSEVVSEQSELCDVAEDDL